MNDFLTRYSLAKFQGDTSYKLKSNQLKNALVVVYFYKAGNIVFPGIEAAVLIFIFFGQPCPVSWQWARNHEIFFG